MLQTTKRTIATLTAAACLGSAGWAIAGSSNSSSSDSTGDAPATQSTIAAGTTTAQTPQGQRPQQSQVTGDAAEKVKDAVLAKEPEATIDRVEQDPQGYHAHITK